MIDKWKYLLEHGWKRRDIESKWAWYHPANPAAHYSIADAFELAYSMAQRERKRA